MKDIYTITPKMEANLTHAVALLEEIIEENYLEDIQPDGRIEEVLDMLKSLPFFARNY